MLRRDVPIWSLATAFVLLCSACTDGSAAAGDALAASGGAAAVGGISNHGSGGAPGAPVEPTQAGASAGPSTPTAPAPGAAGSAGTALGSAGSPSDTPSADTPSAGAGAGAAGSGAGAAAAAGGEASAPEEPAQVDPSAPLTAIAFYPSKDRTDACADASVSIQFNRTPILKAGGKLQILDESGAVFDSVTADPDGELYFSALVNRSAGGRTFKSEVLDIVYDTVVFHPKGALEYGETYFVTVEPGMITDELGTQFAVTRADNWSFSVRDQAPAAASEYSLAADGSGDFCSLEGVLGALPDSATSLRKIQVGPGVYPGIVRMRESQVHFVGAGIDRSIFAPKNCATMNDSREGLVVSGSNVTFEDLTIFNTYLKDSNGQQAEALYVAEGSQRVVLKNVHLRSHQDTLRVDGSAYMEGGKISGSTDPLWGYGAFYCDGCELSSRTSGHSFVVARSTRGFGLVNCSVTKENDSVGKTYLAQYHSGSEPGKIAFVRCKIDSHILGWKQPQGNAWYEHANTTLEGEALMFSGRELTAGSPELMALESAESWLGWSP